MKRMFALAIAILGSAPFAAISADAPYTVNTEGKVDKLTRQAFAT